MNFFNFRKRKQVDFQRIFMRKSIDVFNPLFKEYNFEIIKSEYDERTSNIAFKRDDKYILIASQHEIRDGSFFEVAIGEKLDGTSFNGYNLSINRLAKIMGHKCKDFYDFPFGEKACLRSLKRAKKDFLTCALFYLESDEDLFDKILKMKAIRN